MAASSIAWRVSVVRAGLLASWTAQAARRSRQLASRLQVRKQQHHAAPAGCGLGWVDSLPAGCILPACLLPLLLACCCLPAAAATVVLRCLRAAVPVAPCLLLVAAASAAAAACSCLSAFVLTAAAVPAHWCCMPAACLAACLATCLAACLAACFAACIAASLADCTAACLLWLLIGCCFVDASSLLFFCLATLARCKVYVFALLAPASKEA